MSKRGTARKGTFKTAPRNPRRTAQRAVDSGRRAENRNAVCNRVVEAALALFREKGFDATTTKAIARRARVAEGTVFNYFETKEDIALYFFELEVDHAIEVVKRSSRLRRASLEEKLFALIQAQLEFLQPHQRFIGAAFIHALRPASKLGYSGQAIALRNRYLTFVRELIDESVPEPHSGLFAWFAPPAFWIYYLGILLFWLNDESPGKENTLALLDRSLKLGVMLLKKGEL